MLVEQIKNGCLEIIGKLKKGDIAGAQQLGMRTILVKTGKFREDVFNKSSIKPDHVIESIAHLAKLINNLKIV